MNQMRKIIKKAAVVTLTSAMVVTTVPAVAPLVHVGAAAKTQIVVSNKRTVLVAGRTYSVKTKGATGFKSSNKKVATITKAGKISPKKTGYVNITAKVDGKTVTTKFLCVSKTGSTSSEAKVKKMLAAPNVKKITINNKKTEEVYTIAKGDYSKKTLVVNAPLSDVINKGEFARIVIKDVKASTFTNYADGNDIEIRDDDFNYIDKSDKSTLKVEKGAKGTIKVSGEGTNIESEGELNLVADKGAKIGTVTVKGGVFEFDAEKMPEVKEIVVTAKTVIKIVGKSDAKIPIKIAKEAEGTTVDSSCSVVLDTAAKVEIKLSDAAGGSEITTAKGVAAKVDVDKSVKGKVAVGVEGTTKTEVTPGSTANVTETGGVTSSGGGAIGGGGYVPPVEAKVEPTYANNVTTYALRNASDFESLKSFDVTMQTVKKGTIKFTVDAGMMTFANNHISDVDAVLMANWDKLKVKDSKVFGNIRVEVTKDDGNSKEVKFTAVTGTITSLLQDKTFKVTYDQTNKVIKMQNVAGGMEYTLKKTGGTATTTTEVTISNGNVSYKIVKNDKNTEIKITGDAEYTITTNEGSKHTYFTVSGDTTKKLVIDNIVQ